MPDWCLLLHSLPQGRIQNFHWEGLQILGAPFCLGQPFLEGAIMGEKVPFRARKTPLLAEGAPYLLRMVHSWAKKVPFCSRRAPSLAVRRPYNAFDAKIDPGLRYPADGDENWCPCAFGAQALFFIGKGLPASAAPLWIHPCPPSLHHYGKVG